MLKRKVGYNDAEAASRGEKTEKRDKMEIDQAREELDWEKSWQDGKLGGSTFATRSRVANVDLRVGVVQPGCLYR